MGWKVEERGRDALPGCEELLMKKVLLIADTHSQVEEKPIPAYDLTMKFAKAWKPDVLVHLGDIGDWDFISVFSRDLIRKLEGKTFKKEFDAIERELDVWQAIAPEVVLLSGNHDERVYTAIDRAPTLRGYVEYENALSLKKRGVKFIRDTEQPYKVGKLNIVHGWFFNKYHTYKHLDVFSGNIAYGHVHRFQTFSKVLAASHQEIQAWSLGCLCDKEPEYMNGCPSGWQHGFGAVYVGDNGDFNLYPVNIIKDRFSFEGKEWRL